MAAFTETNMNANDWRNVDMTHMVKPSTFAGVTGNGKYCVEGRNPETGWLDCSIPLPFTSATQRQLIEHFFKHNPGMEKASQSEICKWYNDRKIFFRPKTW
jgi:hypothetical protein